MGKQSITYIQSITLSCLITLVGTGHLLGQPPKISDPNNMAPAGSMPGVFPESITAANVNAAPIPGSTIGGAGSNNMLVSFPASGPVAWTESRHNEGDIALLVGPFDPNDPSYFPPNAFVDNYSPLENGQPFANTTLAWRVNRDHGALLATVRHNGVDNGDLFNGLPVGTTHGVAYFNADFGQGWGYRSNDGVFANGGENSADLQMGVAGFDSDLGEAVFNTAVALFPYSEGWQGAYVDPFFASAQASFSSSGNVDESAVTWDNGLATVSLPGVDATSDGMLFVAATGGGNASNIAAAFPTEDGWQVTIREDNDADFSGMTFNQLDNSFQFLYVPYESSGLIGGRVNGDDGSLIGSAGQTEFSVTRQRQGEYAIQINKDGSFATENEGMLILSVAGALPGSLSLADRKFLSYEFEPMSNTFLVQAREVVANDDPNSENIFGDLLSLRDVDFYFAYVDFSTPFKFPVVGDVNCDGVVDLLDVAPFVELITTNTFSLKADINEDGVVDLLDVEPFVNLLTGN